MRHRPYISTYKWYKEERVRGEYPSPQYNLQYSKRKRLIMITAMGDGTSSVSHTGVDNAAAGMWTLMVYVERVRVIYMYLCAS